MMEPRQFPELKSLLELRAACCEAAVADALQLHLEQWRRRPRLATTVLKRLAGQKRPELVAQVLSTMASSLVETNAFHYSAALSACASCEAWLMALRLTRRMGISGVQKDAFSMSSHLRVCAQAKQWDFSSFLLSDMRLASCRLDVIAFNAFFSSCQRAGMWQKSWQLLQSTWKLQLQADVLTFNALCAAPWPASLSMLGVACHVEVTPDTVCLNSALSKALDTTWRHVLATISSMRAVKLRPDAATLGTPVGMCRGTEWHAALDMWRVLQATCRPDAAALTALLGSCADGVRWRAGLILHEAAPFVDLISFNSLVNTCAKGKTWNQAMLAFLGMPAARILPDDATCSTLLASLSENGCWELAVMVFHDWLRTEAREGGDRGGALVCSAVLSALAGRVQWEAALQLLDSMMGWALQTSRECCNAAIDSLGRAARWQLAASLFQRMARSQIGPDSISLNSVISSQAQAGHWQAAALLTTLPSCGIQRTEITFSVTGHAMARCLLWAHSLAALAITKQAALLPYPAAYNAAACSLEQGGWARTLGLLRAMGSQHVEPDNVACSQFLSSCASGVQWAQTASLMDRMLRSSQACGGAVSNCAVRSLTSARRWMEALEFWYASMPSIPSTERFPNFALDAIMLGYMARGNVRLLPAMLSKLRCSELEKRFVVPGYGIKHMLEALILGGF